MKRQQELNEISAILNLKYQKQAQAFQELLSKEQALRTALQNLKTDQIRQRPDVVEHQPMLSMGGDIAWQIWAGQKKQDINLELARVLARKEHYLKALKVAYGKVLVIDELANSERIATRKKAGADVLAQAIDLGIGQTPPSDQ